MCVLNGPFFCAARYMISQLFSTKSIWLTRFFLIRMWKAPLFWHPGKCVYFFAQRFVKAACSLGIQGTDCYICLTTSNKWVSKSKGSIWIGQVHEWVNFCQWGRFRNTGLHTRTTFTPSHPFPPSTEVFRHRKKDIIRNSIFSKQKNCITMESKWQIKSSKKGVQVK